MLRNSDECTAGWDDHGIGRTVLIVDDHEAFRAAARAMLEAAGFEVVAEAADGTSALAAARLLGPAIVLLDVQLPDLDGFAVAELLTRQASDTAVVLVSTRDASSYRRRLATAKVRGFITKNELSAATINALVG